jgi:hypothetical protein
MEQHGHGADRLGVGVQTGMAERGRIGTLFRVEKWGEAERAWAYARLRRDDLIRRGAEPSVEQFRRLNVRPAEVYEKENANIILDAGWGLLMNGIAGSAVTKYTASVGRIGGGISATAVNYNQTDLQAATGAANRQWELVSGAPTVGGAPQHTTGLIFAATFPTTDGNFVWAEFGVDAGTSSGTGVSVATMLNRGLASPGTKTGSQTWNVTVTITWT